VFKRYESFVEYIAAGKLGDEVKELSQNNHEADIFEEEISIKKEMLRRVKTKIESERKKSTLITSLSKPPKISRDGTSKIDELEEVFSKLSKEHEDLNSKKKVRRSILELIQDEDAFLEIMQKLEEDDLQYIKDVQELDQDIGKIEKDHTDVVKSYEENLKELQHNVKYFNHVYKANSSKKRVHY